MNGPERDPTHRPASRSVDDLRERAAECALTGEPWTWEEERLAQSLGMDLAAETEAFELAAAEVAVAEILRRGATEPPASLRARLEAMAVEPQAETAPTVVHPVAMRAVMSLRTPLAVAAGVALGAVATLLVLRSDDGRRDGARPVERDPVAFIRARPRAVHWPWVATSDPHVVGSVRGEAYFDPDSEDGLLEIEGLAVNDPSVEQYQLWIFDAGRDERYPVDGGVFDVTERGRVVIPVKARLSVEKPVMFAITVEKPGGVVVSARQIALLAKP